MLYLFDTSALLAHYRRENGWEQVQAIFDDATADILLASVTKAGRGMLNGRDRFCKPVAYVLYMTQRPGHKTLRTGL